MHPVALALCLGVVQEAQMPEQQCIGLLHQSTSATVAFVRRKFLSRALQVVRLMRRSEPCTTALCG
jgi:hypothetical protein